MCGITGFIDLARMTDEASLQAIATSMTCTLHHRGPDDGGVWVDAAAGLALGSRRLAIVDLSPQGHQPMHSPGGRYVIAFNGEIYNFKALRHSLEQGGSGDAPAFRGHSDTEVLLAAIERWGLVRAVEHLVGMFAFAVWDRDEHVLHLGRDRLGEKPLYYGWSGRTFLFGSELKALRAHPDFHATIDRQALLPYLRYGYIPAPGTIYDAFFKLPPGTILTIGRRDAPAPKPVPYWSIDHIVESGLANPFPGSDAEATDRLDALLRNAIRDQMVADVPVGALLSGGIDSSTVVALMQAESSRNVRTFTIGFEEAHYNEAESARSVAAQLQTDHTELYVTPREAMDVIPQLPAIYDEPFADSSQIPTFLVSRLARQDVTVALSGDGGDELFGGYERYAWGNTIWNTVGWMPLGVRRAVAGAVQTIPSQGWEVGLKPLRSVLPARVARRATGDKLHRLAGFLSADSPAAMYQTLISSCENPGALVIGAGTMPDEPDDRGCWSASSNFVQRAMCSDTKRYLPNDILTKVDRASMGVSLEARAPLLDHRVVEFAWQLPFSMKVRDGKTKWLLRQVLYQYVPPALVERPKSGFGVPIGQWLRGPLRDWAEALLDERRLRDDGFFDPVSIRRTWMDHLAGTRDRHYHLWDVLMFQAWLDAEQAASRA
jgi:asparagine synthase (glutamine-hydrolysing)